MPKSEYKWTETYKPSPSFVSMHLGIEKNIIKLLEENNVAFDIGSYRSAPPGLRIWGGPTVDNDDIKKLLPWLDWAYHKSLRDLDI